jgi:predicted DNA binding CopG/RHH family protein
MTSPKTPPKATAETLPRSAGELDDLASYYDTHDTSTEMEHGHWVDPRPMQTTSLRLPTDVVDALKARAHRRGIRYTTLLREIIENAVRDEQAAKNEDLAQINDRLARIEAAITQRPA